MANSELSLVTHTAASAGVTGSDRDGSRHKGIAVSVNISAISGTSPTLTVTLEGKDSTSGQYYTLLASSALNATGFTRLRVYPGLAVTANASANDLLPPIWRVRTTIGGTGPSVTATVAAALIE